MKTILSLIFLNLFFYNQLMGKTFDAYPISAIITNNNLKFNSLEKYYFFGKVCSLETKKNAFGEIIDYVYRICDVENTRIISDYSMFSIPDDYNEFASTLKLNQILCFKIIELDGIEIQESFAQIVSKREYVNDCNFTSKNIGKNIFLNKIEDETLHKSYVGQIVSVIGIMHDIEIGKTSIYITLKNQLNTFWLRIKVDNLNKNKKNKLFKKIKKIRNMNFPELKSTGFVNYQWYQSSNKTIFRLDNKDFEIVQ